MWTRSTRAARLLALAGLVAAFQLPGSAAVAAVAQGEDATESAPAATLRARYESLRPQLERNAFGRPLHLVSVEGNRNLNGEAFAVVDHPFERVSAALAEPGNWCHILILPFNTKHCTVEGGHALTLYVGRKNHEPVERAYRLDFAFHPVARTPDYLKRVLKSGEGPLGTRDYVITLEAMPIDAQRSLIHLSYSYAYGTISKLAMQAYLATVGSSKVGFSTTDEGGKRKLVGGMRGVMERNTMRYFLAIEAFLNSLSAPAAMQVEKRINDWYANSEKYRKQLWEMERDEYVTMKRAETRRVARTPS
jgi:hypothetical protein